jgi:hypothetical protein
MVDEERGVHLGLDIAQRRDMADEALEPRSWFLPEAIERPRQEADIVRVEQVDEAGKLLAGLSHRGPQAVRRRGAMTAGGPMSIVHVFRFIKSI